MNIPQDRLDIFVMQLMRPGSIGYLIASPRSTDAIIMRVTMLTQCLSQPERQAVSSILLMLGISPCHDGFDYLCCAIPLYRRAPTQLVTKELYPNIRLDRHADARQVEHSIRLAVFKAWAQRDEQIWQMFFPPGTDGTVPRPTNSHFIARLARLLDIWDVARD